MLRILLGLLFCLPLSAFASETPREAREKAEVIAIFKVIMRHYADNPSKYDYACLLGSDWESSWRSEGQEQYWPKALLTVREALDPERKTPERFCDRKARDAQAQVDAQNLPAGALVRMVQTTDLDFSYPDFSEDLHEARVFRSGMSNCFIPGPKKCEPDIVFVQIKLSKQSENWTAQYERIGQN
jgi:hypothetical protein